MLILNMNAYEPGNIWNIKIQLNILNYPFTLNHHSQREETLTEAIINIQNKYLYIFFNFK